MGITVLRTIPIASKTGISLQTGTNQNFISSENFLYLYDQTAGNLLAYRLGYQLFNSLYTTMNIGTDAQLFTLIPAGAYEWVTVICPSSNSFSYYQYYL